MAGLPKSIIKKYGVSKKAWAVFRAGRSAVSRSTPARRAKRSNPMGKRRKSSKVRRSVSRFAKGLPYMDALYAAGYGAVRQNVVGMSMPLIEKIPAGDYADNVALGGAALLLHGFIKNPMAKNALKTIVVSEAFLAGAKLRSGASITTSASSPQNAGFL